MKKVPKNQTTSTNLRKKAEAFLQKTPSAIKKVPPEDIKKLIEDLQIHQVELEIQGEELRIAHQELTEARDEYLELYDFSPVGYLTLNEKETISKANLTTATLLGVARSDLVGKPFSDFIVRDDRDVFYLHLKDLLESQKQQACELRMHRKGAEAFYAKLECVFTKGHEGSVKDFHISLSDIDTQKKLEADLRQSQKMEAIGELAGGIAHEFNNVLGIILGNTELAMDDVPGWNPASESLKEIKTASLRAKEVVRQILAFARKSFTAKQPFEIATVAGECLKLMRASIPTTIEMQTHMNCRSQMILGDPTEMHQILMNLCNNAVHAMGATPGTLRVELSQVALDSAAASRHEGIDPGDYIRLCVQDTGCGMTPDVLRKIFDPYFTTKAIGEGTGMGLAVIYGIVKRLGGTVKGTSRPGQGTSMEVLFPLYKGAAEPETGEETALPEKGAGQRILFVDDEPSMVNLFKQSLEKLGYQVVGMTNSPSALECFKNNSGNYDLVITDMAMPDMAGDELATRMLEFRPDIPILLCTGHSENIDEDRAKSLGIKGYLMKPLDRKKLARAVHKMLNG